MTAFAAALRGCVLLCALASLPASAGDATPMSAHLVKTGLYLIQGGGGNSLVRFTQAGLILVDGKSPGAYRDFMSQVRKLNRLADLPMRALVLTSADENRTGDLDRYAAAGVPVVLHESTRRALDARVAAPPKYVTFADRYSIRMGGVEVQVIQLGQHEGGGETAVYFPIQRVVAVGNLHPAGVDATTLSSALDDLLKLDFDTAVPAEGPVLTRNDIVALKARLDTSK